MLRLVDLLTKQSRRRKGEAAKSEALFALSAMVGAVTLSRIVTDTQLSAAILRETKNHLAASEDLFHPNVRRR
jgi:TetR/AcrR family transcriptional repressor of nem operon